MESLFTSILINTAIVGVLIIIATTFGLRYKNITRKVRAALTQEFEIKTAEAIFNLKQAKLEQEREGQKIIQDLKLKLETAEKLRSDAEEMQERNVESGRQQANQEIIAEMIDFVSEHYKSAQSIRRTISFIRLFSEHRICRRESK